MPAFIHGHNFFWKLYSYLIKSFLIIFKGETKKTPLYFEESFKVNYITIT